MESTAKSLDLRVRIFLGLAVFLNIVFWFELRDVQARWTNVPPAPERKYASAYGLGDSQFAYRIVGVMIQNLGDYGGRITSLLDYNYDDLTRWFFVEDFLDPHSDFVPYLASYYFGGVQEPEKYRPVLDYLQMVGQRPEGQKWRWLEQAVFIARFKMNDMDKALELADTLAGSDNPEMPGWARQMPAFILTAKGEKEAAYALMLHILKSGADKLDPTEIYSMRYYICTRILEPQQAAQNPLCENLH